MNTTSLKRWRIEVGEILADDILHVFDVCEFGIELSELNRVLDRTGVLELDLNLFFLIGKKTKRLEVLLDFGVIDCIGVLCVE